MIAERPLSGIGPEVVERRYPIYRHPTAPRLTCRTCTTATCSSRPSAACRRSRAFLALLGGRGVGPPGAPTAPSAGRATARADLYLGVARGARRVLDRRPVREQLGRHRGAARWRSSCSRCRSACAPLDGDAGARSPRHEPLRGLPRSRSRRRRGRARPSDAGGRSAARADSRRDALQRLRRRQAVPAGARGCSPARRSALRRRRSTSPAARSSWSTPTASSTTTCRRSNAAADAFGALMVIAGLLSFISPGTTFAGSPTCSDSCS